MRVSELAKELGLTSKEVIEKLAQIQIVVKTHSSAVTPDQISRLKASLNTKPAAEVKKPKAFIVKKAKAEVASWGKDALNYSVSVEYQEKLRTLYGRFVYRLDTNYAKIDRIEHTDIENFKQKVLNKEIKGYTIKQWGDILGSENHPLLDEALSKII